MCAAKERSVKCWCGRHLVQGGGRRQHFALLGLQVRQALQHLCLPMRQRTLQHEDPAALDVVGQTSAAVSMWPCAGGAALDPPDLLLQGVLELGVQAASCSVQRV